MPQESASLCQCVLAVRPSRRVYRQHPSLGAVQGRGSHTSGAKPLCGRDRRCCSARRCSRDSGQFVLGQGGHVRLLRCVLESLRAKGAGPIRVLGAVLLELKVISGPGRAGRDGIWRPAHASRSSRCNTNTTRTRANTRFGVSARSARRPHSTRCRKSRWRVSQSRASVPDRATTALPRARRGSVRGPMPLRLKQAVLRDEQVFELLADAVRCCSFG